MEHFLRVFGIEDAWLVGTFEEQTRIEGMAKYIDYLWKSKIAIEMKTGGKKISLDNAFEQLREYMQSLPPEDVPEIWMVSDFENIWLSRRSTKEFWEFKASELRKHIRKFADIAGYETIGLEQGEQIHVNVKAAEKMAKLHDGLKSFGYEGHNLEVYLVRLLFCMFADDTGIFSKGSFFRYIEQSKPDGSDPSFRIFSLFDILNTDEPTRKKRPHLDELYNQFKYINGALF